MLCCAHCFDDIGLRDILPSLYSDEGKCDYCGSKNVQLVEPNKLYDLFASVTNIYEEADDGQELVRWFREDWAMFGHPRMNDIRVKDLLTAILGGAGAVRKTYKPSGRFKSDRLERWEQLTAELRNRNRYFPEIEIDFSRLAELLKFLKARDIQDNWFRARINAEGEAYPIDKMGAPPTGVASHGRANPPGIPYLYVGSTPETSIAEIRPHTGETATVAEFEVDAGSLSIVDLRDPKRLISPFSLGDEDKIGALRGDIGFLERLGSELTRPVRPQAAPVEYVPSQYLCEFIKTSDWDGVLYSSSVSDGVNLAIFDPAKADPKRIKMWEIEKVTVQINQTA
ncbi:RES family NAD+ phosphorylase [Hoeflea poritis]|uniref:RES family NAD+ phosphorylase n=1 Tax=Hoeflea poritis TaxID=2993659 RepID=A0ABT4VQ26_9HYPH|nr:RES family NAD+ phosphorylase [Hoeflea poritis]MDA4846815.1 RES family NAD+ phosphorylase [Hoeflea poritis]